MTTHPLEMSDEDFLNLTSAPEVIKEAPEEEPTITDPEVEEELEQEEEAPEVEEEAEEEQEQAVEESSADDGEAAKEVDEQEEKDTSKEDSAPDYKSLYEQVLAPFKANGKTIEPKSVEEVIQLMQMGANFTRKMQDIAPHRKTLLMLENNGLLDEAKLSYLIDLDKKDPEAIRRLVKESGIDPLDIDVETEPEYQVGNRHGVSDQEVNFRTALDDLKSSPTGQEMLQVINGWDQASKKMLWDEPEAMAFINAQRESGIYDQITNEIERQKILGAIPVTMPFLEAYTVVGNHLRDNGVLLAPAPQRQAVPIVTKAAAPKAKVNNGDRASAAAQSKSTTRKAKALINPLAMSDDDFMKEFANRL